MSHSQNRWLTLGTSLVIIVLLGAACDSGDDGGAVGAGADADRTTTASETTTTTLPETTTTAAPTPEEEVLAAYQGYWDAVDEAFGPPEVNPESPGLRAFATGEVLTGIIDSAEEVKAENAFVRTPENSAHESEVVSMEESTATVRDCTVDDAVLERVGTGEILDDAVSTRQYIAMLVLEDGRWKVAVLNEANTWEGVAGCAVE